MGPTCGVVVGSLIGEDYDSATVLAGKGRGVRVAGCTQTWDVYVRRETGSI